MSDCRRTRDALLATVRAGEPIAAAALAHVAACSACEAERVHVQALAALKSWDPPSLNGAARERIVTGLRQAAQSSEAPALPRKLFWPPRGSWSQWSLAAAAVLIVAGGASWWHRRAPSRVTVERASERRDAVLFAGAELRYGNDARVELRPATREIAVDDGALEVTATRAKRPLTVVAPRYKLVIGQAHVMIAADVVRVLDGTVEVYVEDRLLARLGTGGEWRPAPAAPKISAPLVAAPVASTPVAAPVAPAPVAAIVRLGASPRAAAPAPVAAIPSPSAPVAAQAPAPVAAQAPAPVAAQAPAPVAAAAALDARAALEHARAALAGGDTATARTLIARARAASPAAGDRAEAELFLADVYLVEADPDRATRAYLDVAAAHPTLAAGETAAFAAAQLLYEQRRFAESGAALQRYLARYPDGRFAREARERLSSLPAP